MEALAPDEPQFDFAQGPITVDCALTVHGDGRQEIGLPKKDKVRSVVMSKQVAAWVQTYLKNSERNGSTFLFPSETGKPLMVRRLRDHWARARTAAKFPTLDGAARLPANSQQLDLKADAPGFGQHPACPHGTLCDRRQPPPLHQGTQPGDGRTSKGS